MTLDVQQVEQLNQKAQRLNAQRQQQIGRKESARQAYDKAVFAYEQKYGVKLDDTNLQSEYNTVNEKLQKDYTELNNLVLSIESGEYQNATQPQQQQQTAPQQVVQHQEPTAPQPQQPVQQTFTQPAVQQPVTQQPVTQQPQAFQQPQGFQQPAPTPFNQPQFTVPQQTQPSTQSGDVSEQPFTPAGWGAPSADVNNNFQKILDGSNSSGGGFGQ